MKITRKLLIRLIKESLNDEKDEIFPYEAKNRALHLLSELLWKINNDGRMVPYREKLNELCKEILSGEHKFTHRIPDLAWGNANQAILLIESLLMAYPPDEDIFGTPYQSLIKELNEMYQIFYYNQDEDDEDDELI